MKKLILSLAVVLMAAPLFAQSINKITFAENGAIDRIGFEVETDVILNISTSGDIINWGFDVYKNRGGENYAGTLEPYVGRVEYYTENDNEAFRGKIKYIGRTQLTWYASYEGDAFKGKLKSIGSTRIEYYDNFEDEAFRGKIKNLGSNQFTWYASYNNEAYRGKVKSVGSTQFTYYSSSDDKAYKGRLASLNGSQFTYYSSFDRPEYSGRMKTGTQLQVVNGIKYFVKN